MYTLFYSLLPILMNGILCIFNIEIDSAVNILRIFNKGTNHYEFQFLEAIYRNMKE